MHPTRCSLQLFYLELGIKSSAYIRHSDVINSLNPERVAMTSL